MSQSAASSTDGWKPQVIRHDACGDDPGGDDPGDGDGEGQPRSVTAFDFEDWDGSRDDPNVELLAAAGDREVATPVAGGATPKGLEPSSRRIVKARQEARRLLREARAEADDMLGEARNEVEQLQAEADGLREDVHALESELARLADEKVVATARLDEARTTTQRVEHEAHRRAERLLTDAAKDAAGIRARVGAELSDAEGALHRLRAEREAFELQSEALRGHTQAEVDGLRCEAAEVRGDVQRLRRELAELSEEHARVTQRVRDAGAIAESVEHDARRQAARLVAQATLEAEGMRAEATSALADARAYADRLRASGEVCREEVAVLRGEAETLGEGLAQLRDELTRVTLEEREAGQRLEEVRVAARRVEQEARANADKLLVQAHAEADLLRGEAARALRGTRAAEDRPRAGGPQDQPAPRSVTDRLTGFHWDTTSVPDRPREGEDTTFTDRPRGTSYDPGFGTHERHIAYEPVDIVDLDRTRHEVTSDVERLVSQMTAEIERRLRPADTEVPAAPLTPASPEPGPDLDGLTAQMRRIVVDELQRLVGTPGAAPAGAELEGPTDEGLDGEAPQPLIGSGGWYAAVPAALDPDLGAPAVAPDRRSAGAERRPRGLRFRRP